MCSSPAQTVKEFFFVIFLRQSPTMAATSESRSFVIKTEIRNPRAKTFEFREMKTMYGGKGIARGDVAFIFASETQGGRGLVARAVVTKAESVPLRKGVERQTPRVSVTVTRTALASRPFGREQVKAWRGIADGSGEAEIDFKLYRQATNKIVGIGERATKVLLGCFV